MGLKVSECWSTHELKERGWTPGMIRTLLGKHDRTRPNDLRVGRHGRSVDAPVKLYAQDRVQEIERTEAFALCEARARAAQDRAEAAAQTRRRALDAQLAAAALNFEPAIEPLPRDVVEREAVRERPYIPPESAMWAYLRDHHERALWIYEAGLALPRHVSRADRYALERDLREKYRAALAAAYPWLDAES